MIHIPKTLQLIPIHSSITISGLDCLNHGDILFSVVTRQRGGTLLRSVLLSGVVFSLRRSGTKP